MLSAEGDTNLIMLIGVVLQGSSRAPQKQPDDPASEIQSQVPQYYTNLDFQQVAILL